MTVANAPGAPAGHWNDSGTLSIRGTDGARAPSVRQVTDDIAQALGAWVVVERCGEVLAHAVGPGPCPEPLADAIIRRDATDLRHGVGGRGRANALPHPRAADARDGIRVWTSGAAPNAADLERICLACSHDSPAVTNPAIADLLQPRGPQRVGSAPPARLVAIPGGSPLAALSREAEAALGVRGGVHTEGDWLYLALAPDEPVLPLVAALNLGRDRPLNAGVADVPAGSTDWASTARLARRLAAIAAETGQPCATPHCPRTLTRLLLDQARAATSAYLTELGISPFERLSAYDKRADGAFTQTLAAWLATGCDVRATALALQMHANTVRYRIRRAGELIGFDLDDPDVQAALRLVLP